MHSDVVSEAEQRRQVRRICPAHSKMCVVSLGEGKRIKERGVGDSYIGKYIRNVGCDLILKDLECVGFVCVCVCMSAQLVQRLIFCGGVLGDIIFYQKRMVIRNLPLQRQPILGKQL